MLENIKCMGKKVKEINQTYAKVVQRFCFVSECMTSLFSACQQGQSNYHKRFINPACSTCIKSVREVSNFPVKMFQSFSVSMKDYFNLTSPAICALPREKDRYSPQ